MPAMFLAVVVRDDMALDSALARGTFEFGQAYIGVMKNDCYEIPGNELLALVRQSFFSIFGNRAP